VLRLQEQGACCTRKSREHVLPLQEQGACCTRKSREHAALARAGSVLCLQAQGACCAQKSRDCAAPGRAGIVLRTQREGTCCACMYLVPVLVPGTCLLKKKCFRVPGTSTWYLVEQQITVPALKKKMFSGTRNWYLVPGRASDYGLIWAVLVPGTRYPKNVLVRASHV
jgi:hypothetical protein